MKLIKFNPDNSKYYTTNFIKGFEIGSTRQFENDLSVIENIKAEIAGQMDDDDYFCGLSLALQIIDKHINGKE